MKSAICRHFDSLWSFLILLSTCLGDKGSWVQIPPPRPVKSTACKVFYCLRSGTKWHGDAPGTQNRSLEKDMPRDGAIIFGDLIGKLDGVTAAMASPASSISVAEMRNCRRCCSDRFGSMRVIDTDVLIGTLLCVCHSLGVDAPVAD
jgi:hypothetical protein